MVLQTPPSTPTSFIADSAYCTTKCNKLLNSALVCSLRPLFKLLGPTNSRLSRRVPIRFAVFRLSGRSPSPSETCHVGPGLPVVNKLEQLFRQTLGLCCDVLYQVEHNAKWQCFLPCFFLPSFLSFSLSL